MTSAANATMPPPIRAPKPAPVSRGTRGSCPENSAITQQKRAGGSQHQIGDAGRHRDAGEPAGQLGADLAAQGPSLDDLGRELDGGSAW